MKLITSAQNEQLKHLFRLLTQAKARRESGETVLEGVHLLQTYCKAAVRPNRFICLKRNSNILKFKK